MEAHSGREYGMAPHQFVRLAQWAVNDGPVQIAEIHTEAVVAARLRLHTNNTQDRKEEHG